MKLAFICRIKTKAAEHKTLAAIISLLLVAALGAGGYFGWQEYQYRQSSQYAFEQIKQALNPPDTDALAHLVDFNSVGNDLAREIQKKFPFYLAGPDQERNIRNKLQTVLLKRFMTKEEKSKAPPAEESEEAKLQKNLEILPPDFVTQLAQGATLLEPGANTALIGAKIENPQLNQPFPLVFSMNKTSQGWKVTHVANAGEILARLRNAMLERHAKLRSVFQHKNEQTTRRMNQLLPIQSCSAEAGMLSDDKTLIMIVQIIARNRGSHQVNNFNADTVITGRGGNVVLRRYLNTAKPVEPGEDFNHRWSFELDADSELARSILANEPLHCKATWQTLGVNNGEVLHIVEVPNPDKQCAIAGHNHPDGFCRTPVFLN